MTIDKISRAALGLSGGSQNVENTAGEAVGIGAQSNEMLYDHGFWWFVVLSEIKISYSFSVEVV